MSIENPTFSSEVVEEVVPAATPAVDAFEAALAADSSQSAVASEAIVEEVIADEAAGSLDAVTAIDEEVAQEEAELEEDDENAEFRRALATATGDWYVVHSCLLYTSPSPRD